MQQQCQRRHSALGRSAPGRCPRPCHTARPVACRAARCALLLACRLGTANAAPARRSQRAGRKQLQVRAIGFDFGDDDDSNRGVPIKQKSKMGTLGTLASSLLVYGHVLKGAVGEAFMGALAATQKYQASNKEVLGAYARFYNLLLTAGYESWQDYVLDQILLGRDNAFARAVAQGNLEEDAPVLRAVAYDLDVLQELSMTLAQLAQLVADAAPTAGGYWLEGASNVSTKAKPKARRQLPGSASGPAPAAVALDPHRTIPFITAPPTPEELAAWKATIGAREHWSESLPLIKAYYHLHGFGITSRNSVLRWSKGAFEEAGPDNATAAPQLAPLRWLDAQRSALADNTARHCEGLPASHALVAGPSGTAKSALLWDYTLAAAKERGLRLVDVSGAELPNILEAARGCGRYPRLRFVLVADHVDFPLRGGLAADLCAGLGGSGPAAWPTNTLLYMAATPASALSYDYVVSRFGLVLSTKELDDLGFSETLSELAGVAMPPGEALRAIEWARARGGLTIRAASQYVRKAVTQNPA